MKQFWKKLFIVSLALALCILTVLPMQVNAASSRSRGRRIVAEARDYLGVRYVFGSSAYNTRSFDCSSFVQRSVYDAGLGRLPRTARGQASYLARTSKAKRVTRRSQLRPGDIIYFKNMGSHVRAGTVSHVGIYIGNNKMIHAMPKRGVIIQTLSRKHLSSRYLAGVYRIAKPIRR